MNDQPFNLAICRAGPCARDGGLHLLDRLRAVTRHSRYGVLVSTGCLLSADRCQHNAAHDAGTCLLVQPCRRNRRPQGAAIAVLASRCLYTDGAEIMHDYAQHAGHTREGESARELVVVRNNQRVFAEVVEYLRRVDFAPDGYAQVIHLPQYRVADVTIDPDRAFGRPRFSRGGARLDDVIELFVAGEPVDVVAAEFGLTRDEVEDALRVTTRTAA